MNVKHIKIFYGVEMELTRTEQIWLHSNDILSQLCHFSKNLWNEANYQIRQEFFAGNRIPQYCELAGNLKTSGNYQSYLIFPKNLGIDKIKTRLEDDTNIREARIIPKGTGYILEIIYDTLNEEGEINKRWYSRIQNGIRFVGIDFGTVNHDEYLGKRVNPLGDNNL